MDCMATEKLNKVIYSSKEKAFSDVVLQFSVCVMEWIAWQHRLQHTPPEYLSTHSVMIVKI